LAQKIKHRQKDHREINRDRICFYQCNISFLLSATQEIKLHNNKKDRKMNRGKVLHASFHFEPRSSMALNAERVASIRPNGTFADARKENKRKEGRRREAEEKTHEREVLPIKLSSTRRPRAQDHKSLSSSLFSDGRRVTLRQPIIPNRVRRPALRSMMHA